MSRFDVIESNKRVAAEMFGKKKLADKKEQVASKMPYLGDSSPRKGEKLSKSLKRIGRYLASGSNSGLDAKAVAKSARRHRGKEGLPF